MPGTNNFDFGEEQNERHKIYAFRGVQFTVQAQTPQFFFFVGHIGEIFMDFGSVEPYQANKITKQKLARWFAGSTLARPFQFCSFKMNASKKMWRSKTKKPDAGLEPATSRLRACHSTD